MNESAVPASRCAHSTQTRGQHIHDSHTVRCKLEEGHGPLHEADGATGHRIFWYNDGATLGTQSSTRFRFGVNLEMTK